MTNSTLHFHKNLWNNFFSLYSVEEYGDQYEGDMVLNQEQMEIISTPERNGLILVKYRWPNKTVAYQLNANHTQQQRDFIEISLKTLESVSCLKFVRRTNEEEFVNLTVSFFFLINYDLFPLNIFFFKGSRCWMLFIGWISEWIASIKLAKI